MTRRTGPGAAGVFAIDRVTRGDSLALVAALPDASIDVVVTSPPYWGQRTSIGLGVEADPRDYLARLTEVFAGLLPKLKPRGIVWVNLGDAYDTPVNWRRGDSAYSTLGPDWLGLGADNSAYTKPRARRRAFVDPGAGWLRYGNLLALPYRFVVALTDAGYLFRGEVVWRKKNPMPEVAAAVRTGSTRASTSSPAARTTRSARARRSRACGTSPTRRSTAWLISRFPEELPRRAIEAYGAAGRDVLVHDPFAGSGTTGVAALRLGCSFVGFEIDPAQVAAANARLASLQRS